MGSSSADSVVRFGFLSCHERNIELQEAISLIPYAEIFAVGLLYPEQLTLSDFDYGYPFMGSYDEVINHPSVDAVFVSLKDPTHSSFAIAAARNRKHVLLDIPAALHMEELDDLLNACNDNEVQFMDCTMWLHHPRTRKMTNYIRDQFFGTINKVNSICTHYEFVKCILLELGVLGYGGWHCVSSILWAYSFVLPKTVRALYSERMYGIIFCCGAQLLWSDGRSATLHCSVDGHLTTQMTVIGSRGTLDVTDFVIPYQEHVAKFQHVRNEVFTEEMTGWNRVPCIYPVASELPQGVHMVDNFAHLAYSIKKLGAKPYSKWPDISRKTRLVIDAITISIANELKPVEIGDCEIEATFFLRE